MIGSCIEHIYHIQNSFLISKQSCNVISLWAIMISIFIRDWSIYRTHFPIYSTHLSYPNKVATSFLYEWSWYQSLFITASCIEHIFQYTEHFPQHISSCIEHIFPYKELISHVQTNLLHCFLWAIKKSVFVHAHVGRLPPQIGSFKD